MLTKNQKERFSRHMLLEELGEKGQKKLLGANVLVIGAGGLGSPLLIYLAASGIGTIGLVDDDTVSLSNLQRQVIHKTGNIGKEKVYSAQETLRDINPDVQLTCIQKRLTDENAKFLLQGYDIIAVACDNFPTRFAINKAATQLKIPQVSASIVRFSAQMTTYKAWLKGKQFPCYHCLYHTLPEEGSVPTAATAGVMGALCGVLGSLQAVEIIKELTSIGQGMSGRLIKINGLKGTFQETKLQRDMKCPVCSTIHKMEIIEDTL